MDREEVPDMVWDPHGYLWFVTNQWRLGKIDLENETIAFRKLQTPFTGEVDWSARIGLDGTRLWISHREGIEIHLPRSELPSLLVMT